MTQLRLLVPSAIALAVASCTPARHNDNYDTAAADAPVTQPSNPVYDTPAAYEESGTAANASTTNVQPAPVNPAPAPVPPAASAHGAATIHTVVAGDTLSGIAAKYKVPSAEIKQANHMTTDTVVLGRKMVIPPSAR